MVGASCNPKLLCGYRGVKGSKRKRHVVAQCLYFRLDREGEKPRSRSKSSVMKTWPEVGEERGLWLLPILPVLGVELQRSWVGKATDWTENWRVLSFLKKARQEELTEEPA